jgi:predicted nucleic acid-binding protein
MCKYNCKSVNGSEMSFTNGTRLPGKHRLSAAQLMLCVGEIRERLTLVALADPEYYSALEHAASLGTAGGTIYDALIVACAVKIKAETIYTWNRRHFDQLDLPGRIESP